MKTVLVLSADREFLEAISSGLDSASFKTVTRVDLAEAEPLLRASMADLCVVDVASDQTQALWVLERLRRISRDCPVLLFSDQKNPQWEEDAYLQGALHVLGKPVRP